MTYITDCLQGAVEMFSCHFCGALTLSLHSVNGPRSHNSKYYNTHEPLL